MTMADQESERFNPELNVGARPVSYTHLTLLDRPMSVFDLIRQLCVELNNKELNRMSNMIAPMKHATKNINQEIRLTVFRLRIKMIRLRAVREAVA